MREGLLWFDDSPQRELAEKVKQAAQRYQQKFGLAADVCYVNQVALTKEEWRVEQVRVLPLPTIRPHHFWIGRAGA